MEPNVIGAETIHQREIAPVDQKDRRNPWGRLSEPWHRQTAKNIRSVEACAGNAGSRFTLRNAERECLESLKHGAWCKPKFHVYGDKTAIVDGDDGKTYILQHSKSFNMITVHKHDFMSPSDESAVIQSHNPERFGELLSLINSAKA